MDFFNHHLGEFAATQIRIMAGIFGYTLLVTVLTRWGSVRAATHNKSGMLLALPCFFFSSILESYEFRRT